MARMVFHGCVLVLPATEMAHEGCVLTKMRHLAGRVMGCCIVARSAGDSRLASDYKIK